MVDIMSKIFKDILFMIFGLVLLIDPSWTEYKFGYGYPYNLWVICFYEIVFGLLLVKHIKEYHNSKIK